MRHAKAKLYSNIGISDRRRRSWLSTSHEPNLASQALGSVGKESGLRGCHEQCIS